jgi:hypothetical protein
VIRGPLLHAEALVHRWKHIALFQIKVPQRRGDVVFTAGPDLESAGPARREIDLYVVPDDQRVQTPRQMFIVWLMASASATTPQRRRTPAAAFFVPPRRLADRVVPSAIVAVAVGFVLGFWGDKFLPGFFCNTLPPPVAGGLVAAILYGAAVTLWPPAQAAVPAPESAAAQQGSAS